jgi:hypothetical protein
MGFEQALDSLPKGKVIAAGNAQKLGPLARSVLLNGFHKDVFGTFGACGHGESLLVRVVYISMRQNPVICRETSQKNFGNFVGFRF